PRVLGAVLLFIVNDTMALIIPLITGVIVDQVITGGHADMLTRLCLIMIVFTLIRVGSRYGYQMFMERFGQNTIFRL
ncbi:ABC transporter ATP-binding protein, partial [Faecalicatena contorta]|nr:ABC transporter ATP-binding protein [Faecalicatena contorta]